MSNMEELLNPFSIEITKDRTKKLMISKIDLDYAYGQMKLLKETNRFRDNRGNIQWIL